jgi:hypothetical protein
MSAMAAMAPWLHGAGMAFPSLLPAKPHARSRRPPAPREPLLKRRDNQNGRHAKPPTRGTRSSVGADEGLAVAGTLPYLRAAEGPPPGFREGGEGCPRQGRVFMSSRPSAFRPFIA